MADVLAHGFGNVARADDPFGFEGSLTEAPGYKGEINHTLSIRTTNATPTGVTFYAFTVLYAVGKPAMADVVVRVQAHKTDGAKAGSWHKGLTVKWDSVAACTAVGASYDVRAEQGASGYTVTLSVAAGGLFVQLVGAAAETVDWLLHYEFLSLEEIEV